MNGHRIGLFATLIALAGPAGAQGHADHAHETAPVAVGLRVVEGKDEVVLEYGPIAVPAGADHHGMAQPATMAVRLPVDGWASGYSVDLVDSLGQPLPRILLHHVNVIAATKRELFSDIMLRIAAAGPETSPLSMPKVVGYRIQPGDSLVVSAMMNNPTTRSYLATIRVRFPFKRSGSRIGTLGIFPFYLDVMPPAVPHSFDLPPGKSERFWEGKPAVAGRMLGAGGHMHKYGTKLRLEDRTEGRTLWEASPVTDSAGEIMAFPVARFVGVRRFGISLDPTHVYRLTAFYDNPTGSVIPDGGMGALGGVFMPARGAAWPSINPVSADYQADLRGTFHLETVTSTTAGVRSP